MIADRFVDVEEEAGDQVVHSELTHFFGEPRRPGDIEEHHDQLFAGRTVVGSQHNAGDHRAADQPAGLGYRADDERYGEADVPSDPWHHGAMMNSSR